MSKVKDTPEHRDALNRIVSVGDFVAVSHHNRLMLATVTKLNAKMIKIKEVKKQTWRTGEYNVYSIQSVKIDGPEVTMFLLSN